MFNVKVNAESTIRRGNEILQECYSKYNAPTIYRIDYKDKSKSYWAKIGFKKNLPGYFLRIGGLFSMIPNEDLAQTRFQSTIIHELIHTIPGCMNHGRKFHYICNLVNRRYPEYQLQTSTDPKSFGIEEEALEIRKPKYKIICLNCGKEYIYYKKPRYHISDYSCSKCHKDMLKLVNYI